MSASAITASTTGASAWTSSTGKAATVKDTKADNRRAEARFQRAYLTSTTYYLRATGGYGDTASSGTGLGYSIGKITRMKACATNNNPLDSTYCSTWQY
ncbi:MULTISPECIES: hypothetical protein [unclassified Isoptericola]|uniref:hypothetical protein n=1 Tax=Isoptericola sp. NPDC057191 TaxID=3346041 RepID=UPI0036299BF4